MTGYLSKPPPGVQLNRNHPLAQGLVGFWLLNEGSGTRANDVAFNNTGTLNSFEPMSATQGWTGSNAGTSLTFNSANTNYISLSKVGVTENTVYTISFRANAKAPAVANPTVFSEGTAATFPNDLIVFYYGDSGAGNITRVFYADAGGVGGNVINGTTDVVDNKTHTATLVQYSLSNRVLYLDGNVETTDVVARNALSITNSTIGALKNGALFQQPYNGLVISLMTWNRALSQEQVKSLSAHPYSVLKYNQT